MRNWINNLRQVELINRSFALLDQIPYRYISGKTTHTIAQVLCGNVRICALEINRIRTVYVVYTHKLDMPNENQRLMIVPYA